MRHLITITFLMLIGSMSYAQWTDLGGTMYTTDAVQISSKVYFPYSNGNNYIRPSSTSNYTFFDSQAGVGIGHQATTSFRLSVSGHSFLSGNLRVGSASIYSSLPAAPLHVLGDSNSVLLEGVDYTFISFYPLSLDSGRKSMFGYISPSTTTLTLKNEVSGADIELSVTDTGSINLNGRVWAKEILIQLTDPWPDFVFSTSYELNTLAQVEEYINKHSHLPNVPSAEEVAEKGINIAEMDAILLQKIEELTLYAIAQQKQIDEQKKIIEEQSKLVETLIKEKK